jgi:hypothetical protein
MTLDKFTKEAESIAEQLKLLCDDEYLIPDDWTISWGQPDDRGYQTVILSSRGYRFAFARKVN